MRKELTNALRRYFCREVFITRTTQNLTQSAMAERLMMADRSYIDLDHGKISCSGLTLALYLIYCCDNPTAFLHGLHDELEEVIHHVA
mgnify:CR=1 FL=1